MFVVAREHETSGWTRKGEEIISNKSLKLWKVPIKTFVDVVVVSSLLFFVLRRHLRTEKKWTWMKKAILEQILDIPCRSILIRSSKKFVAYLLCSQLDSLHSYALIHTQRWRWLPFHPSSLVATALALSLINHGTNAKLSCCWLIINFILVHFFHPLNLRCSSVSTDLRRNLDGMIR